GSCGSTVRTLARTSHSLAECTVVPVAHWPGSRAASPSNACWTGCATSELMKAITARPVIDDSAMCRCTSSADCQRCLSNPPPPHAHRGDTDLDRQVRTDRTGGDAVGGRRSRRQGGDRRLLRAAVI